VEVDVVSLASEFPNDNPALHCGVIWVCLEPTGPALAERVHPPVRAFEEPPSIAVEACSEAAAPSAPPESLAPPEDEDEDAMSAPIVVEDLEPLPLSIEGETTTCFAEVEPPAPADLLELVDAPLELTVEPASPIVVVEPMAETLIAEPEPEPEPVPVPAASGVVLAEARIDVEEEPAPDTTACTPVFEEVIASSVHDSSSLPPSPDDPFTTLVCTLADVAIGAGSHHVASLLPGLLFDGRLSDTVDEASAEALRAAGIVEGSEVTPAFVAVTTAWRAILRGTSDDFDACGAAMLDEWAAELLARLLATPAKAPALRQELRSRGVAAFGLAA
jgi:hypothetical protein